MCDTHPRAQILSAAKQLPAWGQELGAAGATLYEALVREKDIVRLVLLLTGAITSTKAGVDEFAASFDCFSFLWLKDLAGEYAAFLATNPNLEVRPPAAGSPEQCMGLKQAHAQGPHLGLRQRVKLRSSQGSPSAAPAQAFENELRKHLGTERDVAAIVPLSNIGCLCVETAPLKASLRAEAAAWKTQFAKNLHKQGFTDLSVGACVCWGATACCLSTCPAQRQPAVACTQRCLLTTPRAWTAEVLVCS